MPKGDYGSNVLHRVIGINEQADCIVLREDKSKDIRNWSERYLLKLRIAMIGDVRILIFPPLVISLRYPDSDCPESCVAEFDQLLTGVALHLIS